MKVLIDTNVILDVLYDRKPFSDDAAKVLKCCELKQIDGYVSALSIPNIVYVMRKELDGDKIRQLLDTITNIVTISDLKESDLVKAAGADFNDYEDAVQSMCASRVKADYIVTRNVKDFRNSRIPAIKPDELNQLLTSEAGR